MWGEFYLEHICAVHEASWCNRTDVAVATAAAITRARARARSGDSGCWDRLHS